MEKTHFIAGKYDDGADIICTVTKDCAHIDDSWKICDKDEMLAVISVMRAHCSAPVCSGWYINTASDTELTHEWAAHNLLYEANIAARHTKDVDMNKNKWLVRCAYSVLSFVYFIILGKN